MIRCLCKKKYIKMVNIQAKLKIIKDMDQENIYGMITIIMKDNGHMIKRKVQEY